MYEFSDDLRLGVNYQSELEIEYDGKLRVRTEQIGLSANSDTELTIAIPTPHPDRAIDPSCKGCRARHLQRGNPTEDTHAVHSFSQILVVASIDLARGLQQAIETRRYLAVEPPPGLGQADGAVLAFASTARGYEGTGRGFVLRFLEQLRREGRPLTELRLEAPIRWEAGDPTRAPSS